jgi:hypothetical protein
VAATFDEFLRFEAVNGSGDGAAGQTDSGADGIYGERALVEQDFQDGELGESQTHGVDLGFGMYP